MGEHGRTALVLGGGGITGIAWELGILTGLAEAGVDLSVIQALMGHDHVDSSAVYIHLSPTFLREEFDAARARLRTRG